MKEKRLRVSLCSTDTDLTTVMNWVLGDAVLPPVSSTGRGGPLWKTQRLRPRNLHAISENL